MGHDCLEISYFPELTLSAFAGFFAAIFILSLFIVIVFLLLWYQSSIPVKDALRQSEGFQKEGKLFVMQIYGWIIISLVYPSLILIVVLRYKSTRLQGRLAGTVLARTMLRRFDGNITAVFEQSSEHQA